MPLVNAGQRVTAAALSADYTAGDTSTVTVTGITAANLCKSFTIPASDAQVGTAYRLTFWGNGVWAATTGTPLTLQLTFAGTLFGASQTVIGTAFSVNAAFRWSGSLIVMCLSTGVAGTWHGSFNACLTQTANSVNPGTAANNTVPVAGGPSASVTQDTTIANAVVLQGSWGSAANSPTISCKGTLFEKLGG